MRSRGRVILSGLLIVGLFAIALLTLPITLTPSVRHRLLVALNERFDSKVDLQALRISVLPRVRVSGEGLVLRHKGRTDVAPLIAIEAFSADASLFGLIGGPLHLSRVHMNRLQINVPPGGLGRPDRDDDDERTEPTASPPAKAGATPQAPTKPSPLIVDEIVTERAELRILRRQPGKMPRVFAIHHLTMRDAGTHKPWAFRATLRNPTPPGDIETQGLFGPWMASEPAATPLQGAYTFRDADLGVFKGIAGTLSSDGKFSGVLERIAVNGRTTTPDFTVTVGGHRVKLDTEFQAIVDGTNGNTWLQPVRAAFLKTKVEARGGVVETEGVKGRTVSLDVAMNEARIEDVLRLVIKSRTPPMIGQLALTTKFVLPPGDRDAIEKLQLDGSFRIASARFPSGGVQGAINELSRRSRGELNEPPENVASDLRGKFVMRRGIISFESITFSVPGARISLVGSYTLRGERLDFKGMAIVDAKLSQMTTGWRSFLLRAVDPLFRRKGQTVIPLTIGGTVDDPKFGLDIKRAMTRK
jgi:hypothetical protein